MFKMTKNKAAILVAIMLLAQFGIAQHNAVHFTDHGHYEHNHDDNENDQKKNVSEACQICLLTKSLSFGLIAHQADLPVPVLSGHAAPKSHNKIVANHQDALYNPRAPPAVLI